MKVASDQLVSFGWLAGATTLWFVCKVVWVAVHKPHHSAADAREQHEFPCDFAHIYTKYCGMHVYSTM